MSPERQKQLEMIEMRARFFVNAYLRKEMGNDVRNRNPNVDLEVALAALLEALGTDTSSYLRPTTDTCEETPLQKG